MSQRLDPDSDVTTTGWTITPAWSKVDDGATENDADFVTSSILGGATLEVGLTNPGSTPANSNTTITFRMRISLAGAELSVVGVKLIQGGSEIGGNNYDYSDFGLSFQTFSFGTSNAISDFNDLRVRVTTDAAGDSFDLAWIKVDVADAASFTPHNLTTLGCGG